MAGKHFSKICFQPCSLQLSYTVIKSSLQTLKSIPFLFSPHVCCSFLQPSLWHFNYFLFPYYEHLENKPYLALKMEIDCRVHIPPLGSPRGCSHFQYSAVSHSEVVCLSHWQSGLTADAAQYQRQNSHSLENIDFVKSAFCCLFSPRHVSHDVSPQSLPFSQQQTNLSVAYLSSSC